MSRRVFYSGLFLTALSIALIWPSSPGASAKPQTASPQSTIGVVGFVGYVVDDVAADSSAAQAGIQQNDIIVYIDGRPVRSLDSVEDAFALTPPGKTIEVKVLRYKPAVRKYSGHEFSLVTREPAAPGTIRWLYR